MKRLVVLISCVLITLMWACTKNDSVLPSASAISKEMLSKPIDNVSVDVPFEVKNGRLKFKDLKDFLKLMDELSDKPVGFFTHKALDRWEQQIGFSSLRNQFERLQEKYEGLTTEEQLQEFKELNGHLATFDDGIQAKVLGVLSWVLDQNHSVYIGDKIYLFVANKQIVIFDGDESKMSIAARLQKSAPEENIFVYDFIDKGESQEREACVKSVGRTCVSATVNSKRVSAVYQVLKYIDYVGVDPNTEFMYPQFLAYLCSEKKNIWGGFKSNHTDNVTFDVSYGINTYRSVNPWIGTPTLSTGLQFLGTAQHGTGWTQNSAEISYAKSFAAELPIPWYASYPYRYIYFQKNVNNVSNSSITGCSCSNSCE
jgi:hypothetical protein